MRACSLRSRRRCAHGDRHKAVSTRRSCLRSSRPATTGRSTSWSTVRLRASTVGAPGACVVVDADNGRARVEAGAAVDLGGIGKGFSAERALKAMRWAWPELTGGLVDLGGDIAFYGVPAGAASAWHVAVADPRVPGNTLTTLRLRGAGVATSGRDRRRFGPEHSLHHLIDPATGAPAESGPLAVTVVAPDATEAEVHATALAIAPLEDARAHVDARPAVSALYVPHEGPPVQLGSLPVVPQVRLEVAA